MKQRTKNMETVSNGHAARREARVLALIEELADNVGFDVIAEMAGGCTTEQAYSIYLAKVCADQKST